MLEEVLRQDVIEGAKALLGAVLVCGEIRARIVETEAYRAADDPASHAFRGKTLRNAVMFGPPGYAYVYFTYGCHWMLNVTALDAPEAAAVLIRAAEPLDGHELMRTRRGTLPDKQLLSGPGKICQAMGIDRSLDGTFLLGNGPIRIEEAEPVQKIVSGPRIGIKQAVDLPWRFLDGDRLEWCSRPLPK